MKKENLFSCMRQVTAELQGRGNLGTAHVYKSTLNAILTFQGSEKLMLDVYKRQLFGKIIHFSVQNHLESLDGIVNTHHHTRNTCKLFGYGKRLRKETLHTAGAVHYHLAVSYTHLDKQKHSQTLHHHVQE